MMKKYILAFDLGTTGNKTTLFDQNLTPISQALENYPINYPKMGWAEQDPNDFWNSVKTNTLRILNDSKIDPKEIVAMIFTSQMNCTIPIDEDGTALMKCISWLDTRASEIIKKRMKGLIKFNGVGLKKTLFFKKHSGGVPGKNGKDPISHYIWLMENEPKIYAKTYKFLSVKDYLIFKCINQAVTSKDLANTAWLKDPIMDKYSEKILELTHIDVEKLPEIRKSTDVAGKLTSEIARELGLEANIPVLVGSGDLTSVAIGSGAIENRQIIICLGTADWVGTHISERKVDISHYIGTINSAQESYLYVSKQETGAVCFNWFVEQVFQDKLQEHGDNKKELYRELDSIAELAPAGAKSLLFAPWMFGERSPINNSEVRGGFLNLSLNHDRGDLLRAVYEGIAFNLRWSLEPIENKLEKCKEINLIGGAANSDIWCQILADVLDRNINKVAEPSLGGTRGAAIIAMVGIGMLDTFKDAIPLIKVEKTFLPNKENRDIYDKLFKQFEMIYKRNKKMFKSLNL